MTLREIQKAFAEALYTPLTPRSKLAQETREGKAMKAEVELVVKANSRLTSVERLEIYSRSYWYRLLDSLYDDFPGLAALVGMRGFTKLSEAYLTEKPSRSFTLRNLGSRLPEWLMTHPEYAGRNVEMALDMARLEWAHIEAFDSAAVPPLGPEDLLEPGPHLRLGLQPHVSLLELQYPVDDLRIAVNQYQEAHDPASNAPAERHRRTVRRYRALKPERIWLAVHRMDNTVYYRRLEREEYRVLDGLRRGLELGAAVEAALDESELPEERVGPAMQGWFEAWAELGLFSKPQEG